MEIDDATKIELALRFISDQLRELAMDPSAKIDAFEWGQKEIQYGVEVYPLTVILDGKLRTLIFSKEELLGYETEEGRERLKRKIEGFVREEE